MNWQLPMLWIDLHFFKINVIITQKRANTLIDLHLHSSCSDGILAPDKLVLSACQAHLSTIALCDHDTIAGVETAIQTGLQHGIEVIPGVELSVCFKGFSDVHLLGYWIDTKAPELTRHLDEFAFRRANRNREIILLVNHLLQTEGKESLTVEEVETLAAGVIGRPHIARALIQRGYVASMEEAFTRYLVVCDVPKIYWPMEDALATIQHVGGIAVLAHPTSISRDKNLLSELISELKIMGLDGIEVFNNMAAEHEIMFLQGVANRLNLLPTGGSDFHGIDLNDCIGKGRGGINFSDALLPPLRQLAAKRQTISA